LLAALTLVTSACVAQGTNRSIPGTTQALLAASSGRTDAVFSAEDFEIITGILDELAEAERSGYYSQELGVTESLLRQRLGDYAGAILVVHKDMLWAYGHGFLEDGRIDLGIHQVFTLEGQAGMEGAVAAARALYAFRQGRWDEAAQKLHALFGEVDEPDSFVNWLLLVCALEKNPDDRKAALTYRAIRARFKQHPEYWYRGARLFSGLIAAEFAEVCINLAPQGPFAAACRSILAVSSGLKEEDAPVVKTKMEIDVLVSQALNAGDPTRLSPLIPLLELPENRYTVYATGVLRSLVSHPLFLTYFNDLAAASKGWLAERLDFIRRG